jgi:hypothetical protein
MIDASARAAALCTLVASALLILVAPAFAQAPNEAQRSAIRSECRSDYMAHCSDVPPGGMASLQCLQKNMSSLSSGCQGAVRAVEAPEPKAEAKPEAKPEEKSEAKPEAKPEEKPASKPEAAPAAASATPTEKPVAAAPKATAAAPSKNPAARRWRRSAAPAARTIWRIAPACRPAVPPR